MDVHQTGRQRRKPPVPRSSKRAHATIGAGVFIAGLLLGAPAAIATDSQAKYVVLAETGSSSADVRRAITAAGGTVTDTNAAIGTFTVLGKAEGFL
jgi:hypothetical protein